jgi:hypothetical protein
MNFYSRRLWLLILIITLAAGLYAPPAHASSATVTYAAFQKYQNGYMIWRADTGEVWALIDFGFQMRRFPQSSYETLSDNPIADPTPAGMIRPVNGFGRVWGNIEDIRAQLGWAQIQEIGYTATITPVAPSAGGLSQFTVNFPGGRVIVIRSDNSWQDYGQPRYISSLPASTSFPATIQVFEHGMMIWWSETGTIWVLYGSGLAALYDSAAYGALPDNPVTALPPGGLIKPALGFGKVWGNFPDVRQQLGWAQRTESGYQMTFQRTANLTTVNGSLVNFVINSPYIPYQWIVIHDNNTWDLEPK